MTIVSYTTQSAERVDIVWLDKGSSSSFFCINNLWNLYEPPEIRKEEMRNKSLSISHFC